MLGEFGAKPFPKDGEIFLVVLESRRNKRLLIYFTFWYIESGRTCQFINNNLWIGLEIIVVDSVGNIAVLICQFMCCCHCFLRCWCHSGKAWNPTWPQISHHTWVLSWSLYFMPFFSHSKMFNKLFLLPIKII